MYQKRDFHLLERTIYQMANLKSTWPKGGSEFFAGLLCHHYAHGRLPYQRLLASGRRESCFAEVVSSRLDSEAYDVCVDDMVWEVAMEPLYMPLKGFWTE